MPVQPGTTAIEQDLAAHPARDGAVDGLADRRRQRDKDDLSAHAKDTVTCSSPRSPMSAVTSAPASAISTFEVTVVDCRGCLNIDDQVRVGFLGMDVQVTPEAAPGTGDGLVLLLREMAERLCVSLDTLGHGVPVTVSFQHPLVTG